MSAVHSFWRASLFALALSAQAAAAQSPVSLLADQVSLSAEGALVARGNVEAFQGGTVLSAREIRYDPKRETLELLGPILLRGPDGTILSAQEADLSSDLRAGLLQSARLVLDEQLQLAASQISRQGPYSDLRQVAATSCTICGTQTPLWHIRAERVVHDAQSQQLYFENAQLRVKDLPVFWLPYLRVPEPGVRRARGLLAPGLRSTSRAGVGIMLPYFIPLGPSRDLTVTPTFAAKDRALELRYRQAFDTGTVQVTSLLGEGDESFEELRQYGNISGEFTLSPTRQMRFDLTAVSDDAVLSDYQISTTDRIESYIALSEQGEAHLGWARVTVFDSLRENDDNANLPPYLADLHFERDSLLPKDFGRLTLGADLSALWRTSAADQSDDTRPAHDMTRLMGFGIWHNRTLLPQGFVLEGDSFMRALSYSLSNQTDYPDHLQQMQSAGAATLSWPLLRSTSEGQDLLTPVVSLGWAGISGESVPNEDSLIAELDGSNLHALSRLPGEDALDEGWRLSYGLNWTHQTPNGTQFSFAIGQIRRAETLSDLPSSSGLQSQSSDILLGADLDLANGFGLDLRSLIAPDWQGVGKSELRVDWANAQGGIAASYVDLPTDEAEGRDRHFSQWTLSGHLNVTPALLINASFEWDAVEGDALRSGLGAKWQNECVELALSASRRHASNHVLVPSTDFDLSVNLIGFTAAGSARSGLSTCRS